LHVVQIIILVILYSASNILSYFALARVDAAAYTVVLQVTTHYHFRSISLDRNLFQLKIFSTAAFAGIMLGRSYSGTKWRALVLLVLGCILVASPTFNRPPDCDFDSFLQLQAQSNNQNNVEATASKATTKYLRRFLQANVSPDLVVEVPNTTDGQGGISLLDSMIGLGAVVVMVMITGYSSIYFEGMLKQPGARITIW
jgi:hypothetical protein